MSSVLIRGISMPQKCGQCKLFHAEHPMYCIAVEGHRTVGAPYGTPRPDWCPLIEIPTPHGRLIDGDAYIKMMEEKCDHESSLDEWVLKVCRGGVSIMPTVIEAEG